MTDQRNQVKDQELRRWEETAVDGNQPCPQRRRLLSILAVGVATAYITPTLFSVGAAQARSWRDEDRYRGSYQRGRYSRGSYSRGSGYQGRRRSRIREYSEDPVLILEDVIYGPPRR